MHRKVMEFKPGDTLYCSNRVYGSLCECVVQVISRTLEQGSPGYRVKPMTLGACKDIHDNCCAARAIKVKELGGAQRSVGVADVPSILDEIVDTGEILYVS